MRPKDHKNRALDLLKTLTHWVETSKYDYEVKDFSKVLSEIEERYLDYIKLKTDPRHESKIETKSYK